LDPSVANFEGSNDDIDAGTTQIYGCRETPLAPRMATDNFPESLANPSWQPVVGPTCLREMGIWSPARRGSALAVGYRGGGVGEGRLAEGCRRGGIGEVVSRRAVGEVSRVAVSGGSLGAGVSGLVSRDSVGGQTVPARLKKWGARKRRGPWKDGRGMR
jgi:hypothetical protein